MKQIFKKNQVIITALALMLCAAGYLQFSGEETDVADQKDKTEISYNVNDPGVTGSEGLTIKVGVKTEDTEKNTANQEIEKNVDVMNSTETAKQEEQTGNETEDDHKIGEAVMVSTTLKTNFTTNARLVREQRRAQSKETLMGIIDSTTISEEQKQAAVETLVNLTTIAEKESAAELLLEAKGFADPIVNIVDDQVDVVINAESVTDRQIAQIEDIVTRKTGYEVSDIKITAAIQED